MNRETAIDCLIAAFKTSAMGKGEEFASLTGRVMVGTAFALGASKEEVLSGLARYVKQASLKYPELLDHPDIAAVAKELVDAHDA